MSDATRARVFRNLRATNIDCDRTDRANRALSVRISRLLQRSRECRVVPTAVYFAREINGSVSIARGRNQSQSLRKHRNIRSSNIRVAFCVVLCEQDESTRVSALADILWIKMASGFIATRATPHPLERDLCRTSLRLVVSRILKVHWSPFCSRMP